MRRNIGRRTTFLPARRTPPRSNNITQTFMLEIQRRPPSRPSMLVFPWNRITKEFNYSHASEVLNGGNNDLTNQDVKDFFEDLKSINEYDPFSDEQSCISSNQSL